MAHEKFHVICENLCLEEGMTKGQIENLVDNESNEVKQEISVERGRIDNLAQLSDGSTTGDAELTDIRISNYGISYPNAGRAVRSQVKMIYDFLKDSKLLTEYLFVDSVSNFTIGRELNWETGGYFTTGNNKKAVMTSKAKNEGFIFVVKNSKYKIRSGFYSAVEGTFTNTYLGYNSGYYTDRILIPKEIPVFALEVYCETENLTLTNIRDYVDIYTYKSITDKAYDGMLYNNLSEQICKTSKNMWEYIKNLYLSVEDTSSHDLFPGRHIRGDNGNYIQGQFAYRATTGRIENKNTTVKLKDKENYTMRAFFYSDGTTQPWANTYLGYNSGRTSTEDIVIPTNADFYAIDITRIDKEEIASDTTIYDLIEIENLSYGKNNKLPYTSGYIRFNVKSNSNILVNGSSDEYTEQEVLSILRLPETYTQNGKPTPIICLNHGAGEVITNTAWWGSNGDAFINYLLSQGYAVFGTNRVSGTESGAGKTYGSPIALENIHKAFEYIKENYNVEDKMFIHGSSMGGATAQVYPYSYPNDVKAVSCFAPANTLYSMWRTSNGAVRNVTSADTIANCFGYETREAAKADDYKNMIGYCTMLKVKRFDKTTGAFLKSNISDIESAIESSKNGGFWYNTNEDYILDYPVPIKCWIGTADTTVDNTSTKCLIEAIRSAGNVAYIKEVVGASHTQAVFGQLDNMPNELVDFLKRF